MEIEKGVLVYDPRFCEYYKVNEKELKNSFDNFNKQITENGSETTLIEFYKALNIRTKRLV